MKIGKSGLFSYAGSKGAIQDDIQALIYDIIAKYYILRFYDLCGGSGSITLHSKADLCRHRYLNDLDESCVIMYMAFASEYILYDFYREVNNIALSQDYYEKCRRLWFDYKTKHSKLDLFNIIETDKDTFVQLATAVYVLHYCSYTGVINDQNTTIENNHIIGFKKKQSINLFREFHNRLKHVIISNKDALDIIDEILANLKFDSIILLYLDVPYLTSNDNDIITQKTYKKGMPPEIHKKLIEKLDRLPSNYLVIISNYSNDVYDEFLEDSGWYKTFLTDRVDQIRRCKNKARVNEFVYSNFRLPNRDSFYL